MTLERKIRSDGQTSDIRLQMLRSLPAGSVILNAVLASPPNEYKLPASMSFRAELHAGMEANGLNSIETLSPEISHPNGTRTTGGRFFPLLFAAVEMTIACLMSDSLPA